MTLRKKSWKTHLDDRLLTDIKEAGSLLKLARKRQGRTQMTIAKLVGVDARVISQIEKGAPEVSVGIYFHYLKILGLWQGWQSLFDPNLDNKSLKAEIRKQRGGY